MDDLDDLEFLNILEKEENKRKKRKFSNRTNDFVDKDDYDFLKRYRLSKTSVTEILSLIDKYLSDKKHPRGLSKMEQLLITLRFFATSSFQIVIGDLTDTSQPTVSRVVQRVSQAIALLSKDFIQMPTSQRELKEVSNDFYAISNFPGTVGCIDCTHVGIQSPGGSDAERYRCRKGYFSLNVQTVVDAKLIIRNVVARWPGSVHDSTIFNASSVKAKFENGQIPMAFYHLLGDSGYALKPYMMTPFLKTNSSSPEERYNKSHILTRNTIERKYGVLKRRFPCLALGLRCDINNVPPIVTACCVLHNLAVKNGDPEPPLEPQEAELLKRAMEDYSSTITPNLHHTDNEKTRTTAGYAKRKTIVEKCFA